MDYENLIKKIKEQRAQNPSIGSDKNTNERICERCGITFFLYYPSAQNIYEDELIQSEPMQPWCHECVSSVVNKKKIENKIEEKITQCRYCGSKENIVGCWCETCRDKNHVSEITYLLSVKDRSEDQKRSLEMYAKTRIGKRMGL